jgi:hypothetical protein
VCRFSIRRTNQVADPAPRNTIQPVEKRNW